MVPSATRRPCARHCSAVLSTSMSTLSMCELDCNSAAFAVGAAADAQAAAMRGRDLTDDGEAQAAARARRSGRPVKALKHPLALRRRNARPIVFDLDEGRGFALAPRQHAGAHRDVGATASVFERVVYEIAERFAQQEHVALHLRRLELETEID